MIIKNVRLSYVQLFEPKAQSEGSAPRYSCVILIDKNDKATIDAVNAEIDRAIQKGIANNRITAAISRSPNFKRAMRDGDAFYDEDPKPARATHRGYMFINANNSERPGVVDKRCSPILDKGEVYSGCYGHVDVSFFAYRHQGNAGVGTGLNNVMKIRDGERLDNRQTAEQAFAGLVEDDDNSGSLE